MSKEPIAEPISMSENIKLLLPLIVIYLFINSLPFFIFGTGFLSGMWVSKYGIAPIINGLQIEYHIKSLYNLTTTIYKKYSTISETIHTFSHNHNNNNNNNNNQAST